LGTSLLNGVRVQLFDQVKYFDVLLNAALKDDDDIQRQLKSLYCAVNKLRGTFDQYFPAVKNTLFRAYCMPIYAVANCGANTHRLVQGFPTFL